MSDLDVLRKLAEAATPGPWELLDFNEGMSPPRPLWGVINDAYLNPSDDDEEAYVEVEIHVGDKADAEFIAAARTAVPELVSDLENTRRMYDRACADIQEYSAQIAEVKALHRRDDSTVGWCLHCVDSDAPWPCQTIRALSGEPDG